MSASSSTWMRRLPILLAGSVALGLAVLLAMQLRSTYSDADERLRGTMFMSLVNGNTISGTMKDGTGFKAYFLSGGIATFVNEKGFRDTGDWRIDEDDRVCVTWKKMNDGAERCATVWLAGDKLRLEGNVRVGEVELMGSIF